jgi:hypothetical protein
MNYTKMAWKNIFLIKIIPRNYPLRQVFIFLTYNIISMYICVKNMFMQRAEQSDILYNQGKL